MYKQDARFVFFQKGSQSLSCVERKWVCRASRQKIPPILSFGQQNNLRLYWISFFLCVICEYIYSNVLCRSLRLSHLHFEGIDLRYRRLSILIENALMGNLYNAMRRMLRLARGEKLTKKFSHEKLHINSKVLVLATRCFKKYLCIFLSLFSVY